MKQFEYKKVENRLGLSLAELDALGAEGWELVVEFKYDWIFKREVVTKSKKESNSSPFSGYDDWGG